MSTFTFEPDLPAALKGVDTSLTTLPDTFENVSSVATGDTLEYGSLTMESNATTSSSSDESGDVHGPLTMESNVSTSSSSDESGDGKRECSSCQVFASEFDEEAYAYKIFINYGVRESINFATVLADPASGYNPCLVPFATAFLADPSGWHAKFS
jgi:hypothetical protein